MRYIKSYKLFENSNPNHDIVIDALSDLSDEGFDVHVRDDEEFSTEPRKMMVVTISRPGMEHNRRTLLGFKIKDIVSNIDELKSQLSNSLGVKSVYYHIKGYESQTWYGLDNAEFKKLPKEPVDQLSIEFIGLENWKY